MPESFFILYKEHLEFSTDEIIAIVHSLDSDAQIQIVSNLIIVNSKIKLDEIARRASFVRVMGQVVRRNFHTRLNKEMRIIKGVYELCCVLMLIYNELRVGRSDN